MRVRFQINTTVSYEVAEVEADSIEQAVELLRRARITNTVKIVDVVAGELQPELNRVIEVLAE